MIELQDRLDSVVTRIREMGHRMTPQRMAIVQILVSSDKHPSVETIYEKVRADFPMTSLATVYKTLTLLKEMGEILELGLGPGGHRYDGFNPEPHPHLVCLECNTILDLELDVMDEMQRKVSRDTGYKISRQSLEFSGICPECQSAN